MVEGFLPDGSIPVDPLAASVIVTRDVNPYELVKARTVLVKLASEDEPFIWVGNRGHASQALA